MTPINNYLIGGDLYDKQDLINLCRLQKQLIIEEDMFATLDECANIWAQYSDDLAAGWLFFPKNDEDILSYIKSSHFFTTFEDYAK